MLAKGIIESFISEWVSEPHLVRKDNESFCFCMDFAFCRDVHQKWIEGGNYDLCIEDVRDEIWDMVKPQDPLKLTLQDLLQCRQGGTVASMLTDVRGFWAHDNRENLLQEEVEVEEEE